MIYGGAFLVAKANLSLGACGALTLLLTPALNAPCMFAFMLQLQMTSPLRRSDKPERVISLYEPRLSPHGDGAAGKCLHGGWGVGGGAPSACLTLWKNMTAGRVDTLYQISRDH